MLKQRLLFGTLMIILLTAIAVIDGWLDGSLTASTADKLPQATLLGILIAAVVIAAQYELAKLAAKKNLKIFNGVTSIFVIAVISTWYWPQLFAVQPHVYLTLALAFALPALLLYQYLRYGTAQAISNCGVNCLAIIYLGLLAAMLLAIRIDFGLWPFLMLVFAVKSADIGAYAAGTLWGKHKFALNISPNKTWEGMGGAITMAVIVSILFAIVFDIMVWSLAAIFGLCFAFIGQLGDLAESMIKRDAEQKDSANKVPGFGGILDIIDSPLTAAPFAYVFFLLVSR